MIVKAYNYKRGGKEKYTDYRNTKLYGQRFPFRRKVVCSPKFIEESGLIDESTRSAVISAIDRDHGIKLEVFAETTQTDEDARPPAIPSTKGPKPDFEPGDEPDDSIPT